MILSKMFASLFILLLLVAYSKAEMDKEGQMNYLEEQLRVYLEGNKDEMDSTKASVQGMGMYFEGVPVRVFLGIPYAEPPTGENRFRSPRSHRGWKGALQATEMKKSCSQVIPEWEKGGGTSEDCLYLNIWTPFKHTERSKKTLLPVMVWIHGGGFQNGSNTMPAYNGIRLTAKYNVIVVSINYRLGMLGFLHMDAIEASGNMGLKDQQMALQWVSSYITKFGGNSAEITLFGQGAGAASVGYHLLSSISDGYFRRAILQSGSPLAPWAHVEPKTARRWAYEAAEQLGCVNDISSAAIVRCLRKLPVEQLLRVEVDTGQFISNPFRPTTDGTFIQFSPQEMVEKGFFKKTEILVGTTANEGYHHLLQYMPEIFSRGNKVSKNNFQYAVERSFPLTPNIVREFIMYEYSNWIKVDDEQERGLGLNNLTGDFNFICPLSEFALRFVRETGKVYMYQLALRSEKQVGFQWTGVNHGSDVSWIFGEPLERKLKYPESERTFSQRLMTYWTNFAKTGNPNRVSQAQFDTGQWPLWYEYEQAYARLDQRDPPNSDNGLRAKQCAFWSEHWGYLNAQFRGRKTCATVMVEN